MLKKASRRFVFLRKLFPDELFWTIDKELTYKIVKYELYSMLKTQRHMQICLRNLRIACNTDNVFKYRWEK